ncbi:MAG: SpoIIE family protein phosphatase, partial [Acidobacteriota bacterium]
MLATDRIDRRKALFLLAGLPAVGALVRWIAFPGAPGLLLQIWVIAWLLIASVWLGRVALRRFLWRVSNRLTFSYALIGVVPIPLVAAVLAAGLYVFGGFFLDHLFRDAVAEVQVDTTHAARAELDRMLGRLSRRNAAGPVHLPVSFTYYRDGRRVAGDPSGPPVWRDAWPREDNGPTRDSVPFFAADGQPTLLGAAVRGNYGVLARFDGDLATELSRRSGIWIEFPGDDLPSELTFVYGDLEFPLVVLQPRAEHKVIRSFFGIEDSPALLDRPLVRWAEMARPYLDPSTGGAAGDSVAVTLVASPSLLISELLPVSPEVNVFAYLVFFLFLLATFLLYAVALLMALLLIFSLSRAVNRLSSATRRVQAGDFSTRIAIDRSDQIGALQHSFNQMASNLERLVSEAAKKEIFERELAIAQEMQRSLLPDTLTAPDGLRFATYFRPSRAIGGDYYDLLPLADGRLAVVVADVSGHGLPAGLRMAMVKSAFELLSREVVTPAGILARVHELLADRLRRPGQRRTFVTASLAALDPTTGALEIANAGHPPPYLLRDGEVRELALPSPPLGTLSRDFPRREITLVDGDVLVWLSDGLIEA